MRQRVLAACAVASTVTALVCSAAAQPPPEDGAAPAPDADEESDAAPDEPPPEDAPDEPPPEDAPEEPVEAAPVDDPALITAKELHRRGVALLRAGDTERALTLFQRSRALYPSAPNTANLAICLQRLGRFDEALDAYGTLLASFDHELSDAEQESIRRAMKELLREVATVEVTANVPGIVLIDGRERAKLPLERPLRVLAGEHSVRIVHVGYADYETRIAVAALETIELRGTLAPLENVGVLRVERADGEAAAVVVDGAVVGKAPWEGPLAPGSHVVQLVSAERGSSLIEVIVNEGQIALVRPEYAPLGPELRIQARPATARITIDGLAVGTGSWSGRLVVGEHALRADEEGYLPDTHRFRARLGEPTKSVTLELPIDRDHPRWPQPPEPEPSGVFRLGAHVGYAVSPSLGSDAASVCPDACFGSARADGAMAGLRAGYMFPLGLSLELSVGYALLYSRFGRSVPSSFGAGGQYSVAYHIDDRILVRGPYVSPSLSYRHSLADWLWLAGRAAFGVMFAAASDDFTATAAAGGTTEELVVANRDVAREVTVFAGPEVGAAVAAGPFDLGLSLLVAVFPLEGPALANGPIGSMASRPGEPPDAAANAPVTDFMNGERAWSTFVVVAPQLTLEHAF